MTAMGRAPMVKMSRRMPPYAGGRPLVWLDGRGMVVALDPQGYGNAVAGVDDAGIFPGTDEHVRRLGGKASEMKAGRLVGAVLAPHDPEEGELERVGRSAQDRFHLVTLAVGQAEGTMEVVVEHGRRHIGRFACLHMRPSVPATASCTSAPAPPFVRSGGSARLAIAGCRAGGQPHNPPPSSRP